MTDTDVNIKNQFPILKNKIYNKPLVYLDNAATTQKPRDVIDAINYYYTALNSNIHRGVHYLSEKATSEYENSRKKISSFINTPSEKEIIFVSGATEAINLIAYSFGTKYISKDDEIIISEMEHHSNIVPWQILCELKGAKLKIIPFTDNGEILLEDFLKIFTSKTKLVSLVHVSNSLGTVNPIKKIIDFAHNRNIPVVIDGAQAISHLKVDVRELDCDFYVFSGHKMYGPTGIGVLYGKSKWLEDMVPYQSGGDMIRSVTFEKTTYSDIPHKFEAGTPHIAGALGLGVAVDFIQQLGWEFIQNHENELMNYATRKLIEIPGLSIIGNAKQKAGVISFILKNIHPHDIGTVLDREGIAIRTGHHCTQPVMKHYGIAATSRISFGIYNCKEEIDFLVEAIRKVKRFFHYE